MRKETLKLKALNIKNNTDNKIYTTHRTLFLIEGKESFAVYDNEAIGQPGISQKSLDFLKKKGLSYAGSLDAKENKVINNKFYGPIIDKKDFVLIELSEKDKNFVFPQILALCSFDELLENAENELDSVDAIRVFGSRIEYNYSLMLKKAKEMSVTVTEIKA